MAFPLVSLIFGGVMEYDRPSLNPSYFSEKSFCFFFNYRDNICLAADVTTIK